MTTQRKLTRPGMYDNEFMTVTCTPDATSVEFFEHEFEATDAARGNLHPSTTAYVGKVIRQGEHAKRGNAAQIAVLVEVDVKLRRALLAEFGARSREDIARVLDGIMRGALAGLLEVAGIARSDEQTRPGTPRAIQRPRRIPVIELAAASVLSDRPTECSESWCSNPRTAGSNYCGACNAGRARYE